MQLYACVVIQSQTCAWSYEKLFVIAYMLDIAAILSSYVYSYMCVNCYTYRTQLHHRRIASYGENAYTISYYYLVYQLAIYIGTGGHTHCS